MGTISRCNGVKRFGICIFAAVLFMGVGWGTAEAVTLAWDRNPESNIAGYRLYYGERNAPATMRDVGNVITTAVSNLTPGREYYFYVTAYNTENLESDPSETVSYIQAQSGPPSTPTGFSGLAQSQTQALLQWTDMSPNETGFRLLKKAGAAGAYTTIPLGANATSYLDDGLSAGTVYFYLIQSYNAAGASPYSPMISVTTGGSASPDPAGSSATLVGTDRTTLGMWQGKYGSEGAVASYSDFTFPTNIYLNANYNYPFVWQNPSSHPGALERRTSSSKFATRWQHTNDIYFYLRFKDTVAHQVAFYFTDFENLGRSQVLEVSDYNSGKVLGVTTVTDFQNGVYSIWNIQGRVTVRVAGSANPSAAMSAIFIDPAAATPQPSGSAAQFAGADTTRGGTWKGALGSEGQWIATETPDMPSFAEITFSGANTWIWSFPSTDLAALERPYQSGRKASTWYSPDAFTTRLEFADTSFHRVSFYAVDYDGAGRTQLLEILDGDTGAALDSTEISDFENGMWLHYDLRGDVIVRMTKIAGPNSVLSGIFFE